MNFKFIPYDNEQPVLHCPKCQFEYTHLESVDPFEGQEGRKGVNLNFSCEKGHHFSYRIYNHKGYTLSETNIEVTV